MRAKHVLIPWQYFGKKINISDFTHIRAYHACRIEDIGEYQTNGLQPVNETTALANALRVLGRFEKSKQSPAASSWGWQSADQSLSSHLHP